MNEDRNDEDLLNQIDEDMIIEGSTIFNLHERDIPNISRTMAHNASNRGRSVGSKDLTKESHLYKSKKGHYF